jgi:alpha-beta hydrolase superfamily lysophospholipase
MTGTRGIQANMSFFQSRDGTQLHERIWPADGNARAVVVIAHGYGEHIARYDETARGLCRGGFTVRGIDFRGHGQSGGTRGHCSRFDEYIDDLEGEITRARGEGLPVFLLAHSFGALVGAHYAPRLGDTIVGMVMTSPFFKLALPVSPLKLWAAKIASRIAPKLQLPSGLKGADVSRDPEIIRIYDSDPLNNKNATARWATEALAAQESLVEKADKIQLPVLVVAGAADRIADANQAQVVFDRLGSTDKTLRLLAGQFHEVLNELPDDRQKTVALIVEWLGNHTAGAGKLRAGGA